MAYPIFHGIKLAANAKIENLHVEMLAADPVPAAAGRIWFNTTDRVFRQSSLAVGGAVVVKTFLTEEDLTAQIGDELAAEATLRIAGDNAEITARTAADATLTAAVLAEVTSRTNADTTLTTNLNAEVTSRTNADTTLQNNINAEITVRSLADITLQANIDALTLLAGGGTDAEATLRIAADNAEITARTAADATLTAAVLAEVTARTAADTTLTTNLNAEITARTNADTTIRNAYNATIFTQTTTVAATTHEIIHNLNAAYVDVSVMVNRGAGVFFNDIVSVEQTSANIMTIYLSEALNVKVICRSAATI
jgi:hypothetical protein